MRCLLGLWRLAGEPFGASLARVARELEALPLCSGVHAFSGPAAPAGGAAREGAADLPPDLAEAVRAADPDEPLLVLYDRGLFCSRESLERLVRRWSETQGLVFGLARPDEHPCRFTQPQRVLYAGLLERGGQGGLVGRDCDGNELFRVQEEDGGQWLIGWTGSRVPERGKAYLSRFSAEAGETVLGPIGLGRPQRIALGELAPGEDGLFFSVVERVWSGPCDASQQFLPEGRNWDLHFPSRRIVNLDSGELVHGRQAYPEVYELLPEILVGSARELLQASALADGGEARGVPVELAMSDAEWCAAFLRGAVPATEAAAREGEALPGTGCADLGATVQGLVERVRPEHHFVFQSFRGFLHLKSAQGMAPAGLGGGPAAFRLRGEIALPELGELRSVERLGPDRLAVTDERGTAHVFGPTGHLPVDCPGWTISVFACGGELFLCNGPAQRVRRVLPHSGVETVLDLGGLPAPWNACAPQSACAVGQRVFVMVKDKQTLWQALAAFELDDPAGTFRQVSGPGMLQPLAAASLGGELLLFDGEPFGVWRLESGGRGPERLWSRFLNDLFVGLARTGDRAVAVFRKHLVALGPRGRVEGVTPVASLTGRVASVLRCASTRAEDGRFLALDMSTNSLLDIEVSG